MTDVKEKMINCSQFEELLTDYLDKTLDAKMHKATAAHALSCPLCHALLNEVKSAMAVCHEIAVPKKSLTPLEARILAITVPDAAMACSEFENHLSDYLDGFLPAAVFHRWERHAVVCEKCTDLPGEVVRSIAACYTYRNEELPLPAGLHNKILQATIGTEKVQTVKASWASQFGEWVRSFNFPISVPQFAPVVMMFIFAVLVLSQTVSADGSIKGMYQKGFELAQQTYEQGAGVMRGETPVQPKTNQEPVEGVTYVEGNQ